MQCNPCARGADLYSIKIFKRNNQIMIKTFVLPSEQSPEQKLASYVLGERTQSHPNSSKSILSGHMQHCVTSGSNSSEHTRLVVLLTRFRQAPSWMSICRYGPSAVPTPPISSSMLLFFSTCTLTTTPRFSSGYFIHFLRIKVSTKFRGNFHTILSCNWWRACHMTPKIDINIDIDIFGNMLLCLLLYMSKLQNTTW